ncbi:hypothetical protein HJFPF1_05061 [Paramyrothecium foliicola]|nr:hypothetical protein HJFPF1_05061 [Paramyrothecium foliicola]
MDPYDDTPHDHPSQSIHNAAYPDSPYQPGQGQQHHHQLRLDTTSPPPSHDPSSSLINSSRTPSSHHSLLRNSAASWSTAATPAPDLTSPQDPPPPYDSGRQAHRPAGTYSLQHEPLLAERSPSNRSNSGFAEPPIPLQPIHARPLSTGHPIPHNGYYAPLPATGPHSYLEQQQQRQQQQPHLAIGNDDVLSPATMTSCKPAPLNDLRWRKRRRLQICLIIVTLLVIIFVAIAVGVAWKVFDLGS